MVRYYLYFHSLGLWTSPASLAHHALSSLCSTSSSLKKREGKSYPHIPPPYCQKDHRDNHRSQSSEPKVGPRKLPLVVRARVAFAWTVGPLQPKPASSSRWTTKAVSNLSNYRPLPQSQRHPRPKSRTVITTNPHFAPLKLGYIDLELLDYTDIFFGLFFLKFVKLKKCRCEIMGFWCDR